MPNVVQDNALSEDELQQRIFDFLFDDVVDAMDPLERVVQIVEWLGKMADGYRRTE